MSRRLTEALRAALGHDGTTPEPAPEPPAEIPSMEELSARLDAQLAAPIEYVPPDLRDVTSLAGAALALGVDTVHEAATELVAMGKAAPTHLLFDANTLLATEAKDWDPKLHPRDRNGRFIEVGAILNLLGSVGGGRGTVVGNGPNNHVIVRKADGTEVDVPANQTYSDESAQDRVGKPGQLAGEVGKPGTFADTPAAAAPKPKPDATPAPEGRILPTDLPNDRDQLFRALQSNRSVGRDNDRRALNAAASALGASGDGRELGRNLASRAGDQETNDRIAETMDRLDQIADELDADGITVTTAGGAPLADYLRDYAAGFRANYYVQPGGEGTPRVRPGSIAEAMVTSNNAPEAPNGEDTTGPEATRPQGTGRPADDVAGQPGDGDTPEGEVTFTEDEMLTALVHYKGVAYARINNWLRDGTEPEPWQMMDGTEKESAPEIKRDAAALAAYIAQHPTEEPMTVYRGASGDWTADLKVGSVIEDKGFISTTEDEITATEFAGVYANDPSMAFANDGTGTVFEIDMPAGTLAINYGQHDPENEFEADDEENEWIVAPGSKIEITDDLGVQEDGARKFKAKLTAPTTANAADDVQIAKDAMRGINERADQFQYQKDTGEDVPEGWSIFRMDMGPAGKTWLLVGADGGYGGTHNTRAAAIDEAVNVDRVMGAVGGVRGAERTRPVPEPAAPEPRPAPTPRPAPAAPERTGSSLRDFLAGSSDPSKDKPQGNLARNALYDSVTDRQREQIDKLSDEQRDAYYEARLRRQRNHTQGLAEAKKPPEPDLVSANADLGDDGTAMAAEPTVPIPEFATRNLAKIESAGRTAPPATGTVDDPIDVQGDLDEAVRLLSQGKHVRLNQPDEVATLLAKLRDAVNEAKAAGDDPPNVDLCQVSVPGTNLFCFESKGIPRAQMPQLSGQALPGSPAAEKVNDKGEANIEAEFRQALLDRGISITPTTVRADHLRATQSELDGPKVAGMSKAMAEGKVKDAPIFVTRDGYIIDGHHRWASKVALDVADNELGDVEMPVEVLDMDIGEAIDFANQFALDMGIKPKSLGAAAEGVPTHTTRGLSHISPEGRPDGRGTLDDPIDVGGDIDRAVQLLSEGKHIRLNQPLEVATLIDRLNQIGQEAKAKGEKAPNFDLCNVSVPGTNLFCAENQGIDRINMPQLEGSPIPGTPAYDMPRNEFDGNVNLTDAFIAALDEIGVSTTDKEMPASNLRATQRELVGVNVAGIAAAMEGGEAPWLEAPIFVTRDGYVIDGHHRWAAKVALDVKDGELGDVPMQVRMIDMDIGAALDFANAFTRRMGIAPQGATADLRTSGGAPASGSDVDLNAPDIDPPEDHADRDPGVWYSSDITEKQPEDAASARPLAADLHAKAIENEPAMTEMLTRLTGENGGRMEGLQYRFKGVAGIRDKIVRKQYDKKRSQEHEADRFKDALRYTAIVPPGDYVPTIETMMRELESAGYSPVEFTNTWPRGDDYSGINTVWQAPNGGKVEVQFHTDDSFFTKDDIHDDYNIMRNLNNSDEERLAAYDRMAARWNEVEQPEGWQRLGNLEFNPPPVARSDDAQITSLMETYGITASQAAQLAQIRDMMANTTGGTLADLEADLARVLGGNAA